MDATSNSPTEGRQLKGVWSGVLLLPVVVAALVRGGLAMGHPESTTSGWRCLAVILHQDAPLVLGACLLLWLSDRLHPSWWSRLVLVGCAVAQVFYFIDVAMLWLLDTRLSWGRLSTFGPQPEVVFNYLRERLGVGLALAALGATVGLGGLGLLRLRSSPANRRLLLGLAGVALIMALVPVDKDYVIRWMRENVIVLNLPNPERKPYSKERAAALVAEYDRQKAGDRVVQGAPHRASVILVLIESWSAYHSAEFGGVHDWTPELDAIARRHTAFTQFHAGGYCTTEGMIYALGGLNLWMRFDGAGRFDVFPSDWPQGDSVPRAFTRAGYRTAFLTTGPLSFEQKGPWLEKIGFGFIEGNEHPYYQGWPKINFMAAGDEALYRRALQWIDAQGTKPFFLTLETVTSHLPYLDPATGKPGIEQSFRYADRWAAWMMRELERRGFFENGIVIVTGDHRAMVPVEPGEKGKLGLGYSSRVPFVLVDRTRPSGERVSAVCKQGDLLVSFRHWLGEPVKVGAFNASIFSPGKGSVALHRRGKERGVVDVFWPEGEGQVQMAGDLTDFLWQRGLSAEQVAGTLALIARERTVNESSTGRN